MAETDINGSLELNTNLKEVASDIKKVTGAVDKFGDSFVSVSKQVDAVLERIEKLTKESSKISRVTKNTNTAITAIPKSNRIVTGSQGTMTSENGIDKNLEKYQASIIEAQNATTEEIKAKTRLTKELKKDAEERCRLREKNTKIENQKANTSNIRALKAEDKNSYEYLRDRHLLAQAKLLNAKNNQAGSLLRNPRYQAGRAFEEVGKKVQTLGVGSDKLEGKIAGGIVSTIGTALKAPAAGTAATFTMLAKGIIDLGKAASTAYEDIEAIRTQLGVVFSNQTQADSIFGEISRYATKSPFGVEQTSELAILLKQSGVYASDLMDTLKMLGDTAGGNMEKMKRIANNYAQIVSIGKASMLDMRQFAYAGIPIFEAVSKELGVSQSRLRTLISDGQITSEIIEKVFKDLTGINGIFENATEKGAKTLKARVQNLSDAKQLAFSGIGQFGVRAFEGPDSDSLAFKILGEFEKFYTELTNVTNRKNLGHDANLSQKRNEERDELKELIEYNKRVGNKEAVAWLEKIYDRVNPDNFIDKNRATYNALYEDIEGQTEILKKYGFGSIESVNTYDLSRLIEELTQKKANLNYDYRASLNTSGAYYGTKDEYLHSETLLREIDNIESEIAQLKIARKFVESLQEIYVIAHNETELLKAQDLAFNSTNKNAKKSDSLNSYFQKLAELEFNSEEETKKREEKELALLKDAQEELKKLNSNLKNGYIDFEKYSGAELLSYNKKGAFLGDYKLDTVIGKNKNKQEEDRVILTEQYRKVSKEIQAELASQGYEQQAQTFANNLVTLLKIKDTRKFFGNFSSLFKENSDLLQTLIDQNAGNKERVEYFEGLKNLLAMSTYRLKVVDTGMNVNPEEIKKGSSNIPVALWKRIIAQNTGIDASVLTSSKQGLDLYNNEVIPRKMAKNVFSEMLKSGGSVQSVASLLSYTDIEKKLAGDTSYTRQIDWKSTAKNIEEFAMQLRSSTKYISAYKSALQEQYETLNNLVVEGFTTTESAELTKQRTISAKKAGSLMQIADEQFVNAFSGELKNEEGILVGRIENGIAYDKKGVQLQNQNLIYTEKMYNLIEEQLPQIRKKIDEASRVEFHNSVYEGTLSKLKDLSISNTRNARSMSSNFTTYLNENYSEELKKRINEILLNKVNEKYAPKEINQKYDDNKAVDYFISKGNITQNDISNAVSEALKDLVNNQDFLKTYNLLNTQNELAKDLSFIHSVNSFQLPRDYYNVSGAFNGKSKAMDVFTEDTMSFLGLPIKDLSKINYEQLNLASGNRERVKLAKSEFEKLSSNKDYKVESASLLGAGVSDEQVAQLNDPNKTYEERLSILKEIAEVNKDITEESLRQQISSEGATHAADELASNIKAITKDTAKKAFTTGFETLGEMMVIGSEASDDLKDNMRQLTAEMLKQIGPAMTEAGFKIAGAGATSNNYGMIAAGLGLAAAGGVVGGLGSAISSMSSESDDSDDKTSKLESLSDKIAELLQQAKEDADYYERNLRHKTALGINAGYSNKVTKVNDAVITPRGNVISTAPDDYLIATKTPESLGSRGTVNVQPKVNVVINKNTRSNIDVNVQQQIEPDGTVQLIATVEDIVGQYIASNRSDDAFAMRQAMQQGRRSIM